MATDSINIVYTFTDKSRAGISSAIGGLSRLGGAAANVAITGLGAATAAMAAAGVAAIKLGSDAEEMQGKFDVVFANVGGEVTRQLADFGKEVGRSRYELMEMASTFGDTLKPMGFTEAQAGDMSVTLSKLATDLSSFNNMPMDEALQRLQSTLIGNHENALAFGVIINENVLKQELARMGADKLTGSLLEQAKAQARMNLVMRGTTDAQGDAARTSESFANQMRALQATIFDAGTEIGLSLLPMVTPLVSKLGELAKLGAAKIVPVFEDIGAAFQSFFDMQSKGFAITDNTETLFTKLARALGLNEEFWGRVGEAVGAFFETLKTGGGLVEAFTASFATIATPEQQEKVKGMASAFLGWNEEMQKLIDVGGQALGAIKTWIDNNSENITAALIGIGVALGTVALGMAAIKLQAQLAATGGLAAMATAATATITAFLPMIALFAAVAAGVALLAKNWDLVSERLGALWGQVKTIGKLMKDNITEWVGGIVNTLVGWHGQIKEIISSLVEMYTTWATAQGIISGVGERTIGGSGQGLTPEQLEELDLPPVANPTGGFGNQDAGGAGMQMGNKNNTSNITGSNNTTNNNITINTNASTSNINNDLQMLNAMAGGI